ncbi:hypothetical protein [Falsiroseomonas sp. E2-1-a20]|uniref:hypothetical protein n=1 Tax=Falsiroseomonas sp. E2-1-a20 TaxID=3239300 RepID=UPI003F33E458
MQQRLSTPAAPKLEADYGTGAHEVWGSAKDMAEDTLGRLESVAMDLGNIVGAQGHLIIKDRVRDEFVRTRGEVDGNRMADFFEARAQRILTNAPTILQGIPERLGAQVRITGEVFTEKEDGTYALGTFTLEASGRGMAMRLDSETGLQLKEAGGRWQSDAGKALAILAQLRNQLDVRATADASAALALLTNPPPGSLLNEAA